MASKSASPTPSPPASPAPTQSPLFDHSFFQHHRRGVRTVATTPPPSTTTLSPTPDPNEYEKSAHGHIALADRDLDLLKEHVRLLNGLPATLQKPARRIAQLRPPRVWPRATLTSRRRAQLQQRRMVVRCGGNLKRKFDEYERMTKSADSAHVYRQLRRHAMARTNEEMELQLEHHELRNLRALAERAKRHELLEYRDNQGSRLRFKHIRGEPIISSNFRAAYDDYAKPPFAVPRRIRQPKVYNLPEIDKRQQIWLVPVDDDQGAPLHTQPRTPDPEDKRTRKERARPVVSKGRRTSAAQWKQKKGGKPKRPVWNYVGQCPPNIGYLY